MRGVKTPDEALQVLRSLNPKAEITVTNDEKPILLSWMNGEVEDITEISAHPEITPIETVGAGDSFGATYAVARSKLSVEESGKLGSLIASQVILFNGALPRVGVSLDYGARVNDPRPTPQAKRLEQ